jgi:vacuolar-type H+-ATPase subunit F/Vma7
VNAAFAIGDAPTVRGFELAGFRGIVAETSAAVHAALARAREEGARLVVISEAAALLAPEVQGSAGGPLRTLVVAVPSLAGARDATAGEGVRRVVRRALGVPKGRIP